ncbi:urocanate hydratase-like protein, partial [Euroglyphus maynei]
MKYLSNLEPDQTMVLSSGHPLGVFPSLPSSSRLLISNGNMVANYSSKELYNRYFALGVTMYGQMTAGSFCYIGPQGIVHGTTITVLNAARKHLQTDKLSGKVFVSSGLGGMSGAQPKAGVIAGCISVIAEVSIEALNKRKRQGWLMEVENDLDKLMNRIEKGRNSNEIVSIGYHGNVVDLWEKFVEYHRKTGKLLVELGSDQTSCHCPFTGGYYPVGLSYEKAKEMLENDPDQFRILCQKSLVRQVAAINYLAEQGMYFWDYGNAFLLEAYRAGADLNPLKTSYGIKFKYASYVQDIMGDVFSLGFGPFRWICTSGNPEDLNVSDQIALDIMTKLSQDSNLDEESKRHYEDNIKWIQNAKQHQLVVGSQARILYSNHDGRVAIARAFNQAIRNGKI